MRPDGKSIYVTDNTGKLLTLTRDGAVTATLKDPAFKPPFDNIPNLQVAATGQVFVLDKQSVSQVDTDGKKVLNTIQLDMPNPTSVYFNEDTSMMIFGFWNSYDILVFKTKVYTPLHFYLCNI